MLDLEDPLGQELPTWEPGAHVDLRLPNGITRQYSLCGDPSDRSRWRLAVLREQDGRGGSEYVHDAIHEGDELLVSGLRNHFPLEVAKHYIFIAGGIGITALLPMISAAAQAGIDWQLHYGGRNLQSMAFLDLLQAKERVTLYPFDEVGLIDLESVLGTPKPDTLVYCCGPEPLLRAVEDRCAAWPPDSLHTERFAPKDVGDIVRPGSFEVELAASGFTVVVPPDKSVLEVLEEAGVEIVWSCQEGTCGTCEVPVLQGKVDHRDSVLTAHEQASNTSMFVCVSRAACPKLVLAV